MWFSKKRAAPPPPARSAFSTHDVDWSTLRGPPAPSPYDVASSYARTFPTLDSAGTGADASDGVATLKLLATMGTGMPELLGRWYTSQAFIGHPMCALLAQHWLINKACTMPARDALRNGYDVVSVADDELDPTTLKVLKDYDRRYRVVWNAEQFVRMGRIFGIRIAFFRVDSTDPDYYEKPFNADGVTPGSYRGIVQVDPYWCAPELDANASANPDTPHFFEPTWWRINGRRYHRSHLCIFRHAEPPDLLKPAYLYGGIPVPQQIMERVYGAERAANEGPLLAESKRLNVWLTNMADLLMNADSAAERMRAFVEFRDNHGIRIGDKDADSFMQFETSLADLDNVIMTQYQLVAAASNVPATKLLATTPKGFNATGRYEEASYHEELESVQRHDLTPFLERHHLLVLRAFADRPDLETSVTWRPLDSPTAQELAQTNLLKAQTGQTLVSSGALTGEIEQKRIATDPASGYAQLGIDEDALTDADELAAIGLSQAAIEAARQLDLGAGATQPAPPTAPPAPHHAPPR